jgi:hypothetical protein
MKPENIDLFIDRLCGVFPKDNVARNTVKRAWGADDFLLRASIEDGRKCLSILEKDKGFPSLNRVKEVLRSLAPVKEHSRYCNKCEGTGWDTGMRLKRDYSKEDETWIMVREPYQIEEMNHMYTAVLQCSCKKEEIEAYDAETMEMSYL